MYVLTSGMHHFCGFMEEEHGRVGIGSRDLGRATRFPSREEAETFLAVSTIECPDMERFQVVAIRLLEEFPDCPFEEEVQ